MPEPVLHPRVARFHEEAMTLRLVAHEADIAVAAVLARRRNGRRPLHEDIRFAMIAAKRARLAPQRP
jgi:hypothetical protein